MYSIDYSHQFKKDVKRCVKRGLDIQALSQAVSLLADTGTLPLQYKSHKLSGKYAGLWECHIEPDWLMVWEQDDKALTLLFLKTGTHSDIF
ncbi:MAG: type II toxin-antitoxin system YafQ family toxin [Paludibacteraceae bacterium]